MDRAIYSKDFVINGIFSFFSSYVSCVIPILVRISERSCIYKHYYSLAFMPSIYPKSSNLFFVAFMIDGTCVVVNMVKQFKIKATQLSSVNNNNNNNKRKKKKNNKNQKLQSKGKNTNYNHHNTTNNTDANSTITTAVLTICSEPIIHDPRELETILVCSLRTLFGDFECYSTTMKVVQVQQQQQQEEKPNRTSESKTLNQQQMVVSLPKVEPFGLEVHCPFHHVQAIRAAMTWLTVPPYMEEQQLHIGLYRIEISNVVRF